MTTLHIENAVSDYEVFKSVFDSYAEVRRNAGVLRHRLHRPVGDANRVVIDLDFGTAEQAQRFLDFLTTQVWSSPERAPALVGKPHAMLLDLVEESAATGVR